MAFAASGDNWKAAECYRKALERDPGNQEYINKLDEVEKMLQEEVICVSNVQIFHDVCLFSYFVTNISNTFYRCFIREAF